MINAYISKKILLSFPGGMMNAGIAPEHVSAEAEHLQNIKKGEIASEYISEAVQAEVKSH